MIARSLRQLVPTSLLRNRWVVVLVCYLDDSGKDPQNPITTIAGYVARDTGWEAFEADVERWFAEFKVGVLHAKQLHDTDGDFKGWKTVKKHAFVSRVCQSRNPNVIMGLSMSVLKTNYLMHAAERERARQRTATPYAFCFNVINDWIFRDIQLGGAANTEGVAYVIEAGNENNGELEVAFHEIRRLHPDIAPMLRSISFVSKESCRAVQLADLLAFYSRRSANAQQRAVEAGLSEYNIETMDKIIIENLSHRAFCATDFGPHAKGSRFLGGDL